MHTRSPTLLWLLWAVAPLVYASCGYGTSLQPGHANGSVKVSTFGYIGEKGPVNWAGLNPSANELCATGDSQSPINLMAGVTRLLPRGQVAVSVPDLPQGADFDNLGTTVGVSVNEGNLSLGGGGAIYTMQQFHFHLPSEHLENGMSSIMELHSVWESQQGGQIAVLAAFIDALPEEVAAAAAGSQTAQACSSRITPQGNGGQQRVMPLLETVLGSVTRIPTPGLRTRTPPLPMSDLVNVFTAGQFRMYQGSLTTPPCTQGVTWLMSDQRLFIRESTFYKARSVLGFNARFVQNTPGQPNMLSSFQVQR